MPRGILCVTEGQIKPAEDGRLAVDVPKMRVYVNRWTAQGIAAQFTYLGPTSVQSLLASGAMRGQFGRETSAPTSSLSTDPWGCAPITPG